MSQIHARPLLLYFYSNLLLRFPSSTGQKHPSRELKYLTTKQQCICRHSRIEVIFIRIPAAKTIPQATQKPLDLGLGSTAANVGPVSGHFTLSVLNTKQRLHLVLPQVTANHGPWDSTDFPKICPIVQPADRKFHSGSLPKVSPHVASTSESGIPNPARRSSLISLNASLPVLSRFSLALPQHMPSHNINISSSKSSLKPLFKWPQEKSHGASTTVLPNLYPPCGSRTPTNHPKTSLSLTRTGVCHPSAILPITSVHTVPLTGPDFILQQQLLTSSQPYGPKIASSEACHCTFLNYVSQITLQ